MKGELTKAQMAWMYHYKNGAQNGKPYPVNSVWTRGNGASQQGLLSCRNAGFITSHPDASINPTGHRHDITPAGRAALSAQEDSRDG